MISSELKNDAIVAWQEYAAALAEAFDWKKGGLDTFAVDQAFKTDDPLVVENFIRYARQATQQVRAMKFVGER